VRGRGAQVAGAAAEPANQPVAAGQRENLPDAADGALGEAVGAEGAVDRAGGGVAGELAAGADEDAPRVVGECGAGRAALRRA